MKKSCFFRLKNILLRFYYVKAVGQHVFDRKLNGMVFAKERACALSALNVEFKYCTT